MLNENDESAFPVQVGNTIDDLRGMSLLDWFAGQAMVGAYDAWMAECRDANVSSVNMAKECYLLADAMMNERKRRNDERK